MDSYNIVQGEPYGKDTKLPKIEFINCGHHNV